MKRWDATRVFCHPLWWGALAALVVNDHLLKGAGLLPGEVTGKLSDVAGLLVAPWVLAFVLRATTKRAVLLAHVAVGLGFAGINLSASLARAVEGVSALVRVPWRITVDAGDLWALPTLTFSFLVLGAVAREAPLFSPGTLARTLRGTAFTAGLIACVATSRLPEGELVWGALFVVNSTDEARIVTTRPLRPDVSLDCAFVAEDPSGRLSRGLFDQVQAWELQPGDAVAIDATHVGGCQAWLIGGAGAQASLLFWQEGEAPPQGSRPVEEVQESAELSIFLEEEEGVVLFSDHPLRYAAPPVELPAPGQGCQVGGEGRLVWSQRPPVGSFSLGGVTTSPDGCHAMDLVGDGDDGRLFLCLDGAPLPFSVGEALTVSEHLQEGALVVSSESVVLRVTRGSSLAAPALAHSVLPQEGCTGSSNACGSTLLRATVAVSDQGETRPIGLGEELTLGSGVRLYLAAAWVAPVRDAVCDPAPIYLESFSLREPD